MIDERELRIGSLVYPIINGEVIMNPHTIKGITDKSVYIGGINDSDAAEISFDNICSIPLSKGILSQCGFVKLDYTYNNETHYNFGDFGLVYNGKAYYYGFVRYKSSDDGTTEIPRIVIQISSNETLFVHQLQNIYFALTGEELKIDL